MKKSTIKKGMLVYWTDPDNDLANGIYIVTNKNEESVDLSNGFSETEIPYNELRELTDNELSDIVINME